MTAVELHTADTAAAAKRAKVERTAADIAAARTADDRLETSQLVHRCEWIVGQLRGLDPDTADDLTADLLAYAGERFGWTPRKGEVTGEFLRLWAVGMLRDRYTDRIGRSGLRGLDTAAADTDTDSESRGVLAEAEARAGALQVTPAPDPAAADIAAALDLTDAEADALAAALSGWGSAMDAANVWGCSYAAARKRLQRGRDALRRRYPAARDLAAAVAEAIAELPDPAADSGRMALDIRPAAPQRVSAPRPAAAPAKRSADVLRFIADAERYTAARRTPDGHGSAADVLRFIDRSEVRQAIASATPDRSALPMGGGIAKGSAAALPDVWRGHDLPVAIAPGHRQNVPTLPARNYTRSTADPAAGTVPNAPRAHLTAAADVLRHLAQLEHLADIAAGWAAHTPQGQPVERCQLATWAQLAPIKWAHGRGHTA